MQISENFYQEEDQQEKIETQIIQNKCFLNLWVIRVDNKKYYRYNIHELN